MRHRDMNAHFAGEEVHLFPTANVGIAVAVPHGLVVPVITNCERKTIPEIAAARADLVSRTRDGKLKQADLEDGTFTISNLGMYGVDRFVAVLNPPQAGILAVGAIQERAVVEDGERRRASGHGADALLRPPIGRRRHRVRVPRGRESVPGRTRPGSLAGTRCP